jgi:mono/diheme cytochrome c family protein
MGERLENHGAGIFISTLLIGALVAAASGRPAAAQEPASARDGVYTDAQAVRGQDAFNADCATCHPAKEGSGDGTAPRLWGPEFISRWADRTVGDILVTMRTTMPPNSPASLAKDTYADVLAYVLKMNGFPGGATDLGAGSTPLDRIAVQTKAR